MRAGPQDLTAREIDQAVALFRDGLEPLKQIAAQMSKVLTARSPGGHDLDCLHGARR